MLSLWVRINNSQGPAVATAPAITKNLTESEPEAFPFWQRLSQTRCENGLPFFSKLWAKDTHLLEPSSYSWPSMTRLSI